MSSRGIPELLALDTCRVFVDREARQRREFETEDLEQSIKNRGQLQPIVVELQPPSTEGLPWKLVAGERRLTACTKLGIKVLAIEVKNLSPIELQLIELEENIKRQDLQWQEIANAVARVHQLHLDLDESWTMAETGEVCGLTIGTISLYLRVQAELKDNTRVAEAGTVREAFNIVTRRDQRAMAGALEELISPPQPRAQVQVEKPDPAQEAELLKDLPEPQVREHKALVPPPKPPGPPSVEETILHESFLTWAPNYSGPRATFIHCDFPYGIDFSQGPQGMGSEERTYADGAQVYRDLVHCLLDNRGKIMATSCHLMFWYSEQHGDWTREQFAKAGLKVQVHNLIWLKTSNDGISPDVKRRPRHIYETAMLVTRGDPLIVKIKSDGYPGPINKDLHPSTKPEPMLKHFFEMFVDEHTVMLDPTCGSGASIRAAEHFKAKSTLGLEIDEGYLRSARKALADARAKAAAAAAVGPTFGL